MANNCSSCPRTRAWRAWLPALLFLATGALLAGRTEAQAPLPILRLPGHTLSSALAARRTGAVAANEQIQVAFTLPLRNPQALEELIPRLYDPHDPQYGHFLTPEEFQSRFSPTEAQYAAVAAYARAQGLTLRATSPNRLLLNVSGTAATVERAFGTRLARFQARDGRVFRAPEVEPAIPAALAGSVTGVVGLDTLAVRHPHHRKRGVAAAAAGIAPRQPGSGPGGGFTPTDIRAAYNLAGTSLDGSGQVLGLFQLDGYTASDITTYANTFGLRRVPLQNILIDGFNGRPGSGSDEVTLDIELQMALAPGAAKIIVYEGPNTDVGVLDTYNRIATDNAASSISSSWGLSETLSTDSFLRSESAIFQQMAAQGQSMFAASGDSGAYDDGQNLTVDDPASQPYITAVGGTHLVTNGAGGTWRSETTWNNGSPEAGAGGGGISSVWAIPSYQVGAVTTASRGSTTRRNVPDVALDSDPETGYAIYSGGSWYVFGGTSCAAPLWAAFTALVNQQRTALGLGSAGFLNPQLYTLGKSQGATDFHDIADGSTNLFYPAVSGYDDATGWGSFNGANLLADLAGTVDETNPGPTITGCVLTPINISSGGGTLNISVDVTGTSEIASVTATGTASTGTPLTLTLSRVDSSSTYTGTFALPANTSSAAVSYTVTVSATDVSGNTTTSNCGSVSVSAPDTTPPTFQSCSVAPATLTSAGGTVTFTTRVTDASGIAAVEARVTSAGETTVVPLNATVTGTYSSTAVLPGNSATTAKSYTVVFAATDAHGNTSTTTWGSVTVAAGDNTAPKITSCKVTPTSLTASGGAVSIVATVTDNETVASVSATLDQSDGTTTQVALTLVSGSKYFATFSAPANTGTTAQTYAVTLRAMDAAGNATTADCGSFTVAAPVPDRTRPRLTHCRVTPRTLPARGGTITISVTATDNVGIANVTATVSNPDGTATTLALTQQSGSTYSATYTLPANTSRKNLRYGIKLIASDEAVNTRSLSCGSVTVKRP